MKCSQLLHITFIRIHIPKHNATQKKVDRCEQANNYKGVESFFVLFLLGNHQLTLWIIPSLVPLLIFLNSSYKASTSLTVTAQKQMFLKVSSIHGMAKSPLTYLEVSP